MTSSPLFLGIDVGTTTVKATLVDGDARVLAQASVGYPTSFLQPSWVEQDPEAWWQATLAVLAELTSRTARGLLSSVSGISVSAQAPTLISLDASGEVIRPAMIWMDRRADAECAVLAEKFGNEAYLSSTGNRIDPFYVAPKLLWLFTNEPATVDRTAAFMQINGYIAYRLTGSLSMDEQHASLLGLRDIQSGTWSASLLADVGVREDQFPAISDATAVIGEVSAAAARVTGIPSGTPVVAGTVDSAAASLEAGVVGPGQAAEMTGTSTVVVLPVAHPPARSEFITMASVLPGKWLALAAMVSTGASLKWLKDLVAPSLSFTELTERAKATPIGGGGMVFLPYMMGERSPLWSTSARGMFLGLTLGSGVPELTRAVLEGTAFALRHNLEIAAELDIRPPALRSLGGPAASDLWCQIKADVSGIPIVRMHAPTGATLGDAMIAMVGTGHAPDISALAEATARVDREFVPDGSARARYDELFAVYRSSYEHVKDDLVTLARLSDPKDPE